MDETAQQIYISPATAYIDTAPITTRHIKIGDSAYNLDPISSQGVQKAIKSGVHGAAVVNTILSNKGTANVAIKYYQQMIRTEVQDHQRNAGRVYAEQDLFLNSDFWKIRQRSSYPANPVSNLHLKIRSNDLMLKNSCYKEVEAGILHNDLIKPIRGLQRDGDKTTFVLLNEMPVEELVSCCHNLSASSSLQKLKEKYSLKHPMKVLQWLVFHQLLIPAAQPSPF